MKQVINLKKVVIFGGSGGVGQIHASNLEKVGCQVSISGRGGHKNDRLNGYKYYDINKVSAQQLCEEYKYEQAVVCYPDDRLFECTANILQAGFRKVLIEKPASMFSWELKQLMKMAEEKKSEIYINYQRSFDSRIQELLSKVREKVEKGYGIDYVRIESCDKDCTPQSAKQNLNQGSHDYALLLSIFREAGLSVDSIQSRGLSWQGVDDTRIFQVFGQATSDPENRAHNTLFDVSMRRTNSQGSFSRVEIKMSIFDESNGHYSAHEETQQFPQLLDQAATWKTVWNNAFHQSAYHFVHQPTSCVDAQLGFDVLRFAEIASSSFINQKTVHNISLSPHKHKQKWITLASQSNINQVLHNSVNRLSHTTQIVAAMKQRPQENPIHFINKYPNHSIIPLTDKQSLFLNFNNFEEQICFYHPSIPTQQRQDDCIQILNKYPNSIILIEKPSNINSTECKLFIDKLQYLQNRVLVGYHDGIHPNRQILINKIKENAYQVKKIYISFNYPKDPYINGDKTRYMQGIGGSWLDLGVYCVRLLSQISQQLDFNFLEFEDENINMKKTVEGVEYWSEVNLLYLLKQKQNQNQKIQVELVTKINPGIQFCNEIRVELEDGQFITQMEFAHPGDSLGVFIEKPTKIKNQYEIIKLEGSQDNTCSYALQIQHCNNVVQKKEKVNPIFTLQESLKLHLFIDQIHSLFISKYS